MTYIPSHLASLQLEELRRQAQWERRSRQPAGLGARAAQPTHAEPGRKSSLKLPLLAFRRTANQS